MKITSTGRGGSGNIRSPSRDASRGGKESPETSLVRSENRGRGYDRDIISVIDDARDGVVRGSRRYLSIKTSPSLNQKHLIAFVWPWW